MRVGARLACASLVRYCGGWFPFYSDVNICEFHYSVTARYVKNKQPSLREVSDDTVWRTFERLGYSYKARRRKAAVAEKHKACTVGVLRLGREAGPRRAERLVVRGWNHNLSGDARGSALGQATRKPRSNDLASHR